MPHLIFQPVAVVMLLTMLVWFLMYIKRNSYVISNKIDPQALSSPTKINELLPEHVNNSSNNLKNLFELPVIFYAVCLSAWMLNTIDSTLLYLAWAFAISRVLHSIIQCTFNTVIIRFGVYFISSLFLWAMVIKFALTVLL